MHDPDRDRNASPPSSEGGDGVRISRHGRSRRREWSYLALALALTGVGAGYLWMRSGAGNADDARIATESRTGHAAGADASTGSANATDPAAAATPPRIVATAQPAPPEPPPGPDDLARYVPAGEVPTMNEVIDGLHAAGIRTGLGAFNPPGTSPPLIGLAVPEDFPLPEGYVRHYQATDDGQRIEPILMFSPDFQFFDADGRPIPIPENRVVPPELAPPGLTIRPIVLPPPRPTPSGRPSI